MRVGPWGYSAKESAKSPLLMVHLSSFQAGPHLVQINLKFPAHLTCGLLIFTGLLVPSYAPSAPLRGHQRAATQKYRRTRPKDPNQPAFFALFALLGSLPAHCFN